MRETILKAVAMPPRIFWAPAILFLVNFAVQVALMFVAMGVLDANPLWFVFSFFIVHLIIVVYGAKDPHLSHLLLAWGKSGPTTTKNVYSSRGTKFAP